jgi:hypothetical protein
MSHSSNSILLHIHTKTTPAAAEGWASGLQAGHARRHVTAGLLSMVVVAGPCWQRWHPRLQKDGHPDFTQVTHGEGLGSPSSAATAAAAAAATGGVASNSSREETTSSSTRGTPAALWLFTGAIIYMYDDRTVLLCLENTPRNVFKPALYM